MNSIQTIGITRLSKPFVRWCSECFGFQATVAKGETNLSGDVRPERLLVIFAMVLLIAPGSPASVFDGLPFGNKSEVVALVLIAGVVVSRPCRVLLRTLVPYGVRRQAVVLVLIGLAILKTFTFLHDPIGDRFELCLKGTYRPVGDICEESFEYLFGSRDRVNALGAISRVDRVVNFRTTTGDAGSLWGASRSTWNLPFQNDYPRFGELWLDRLPFGAKVGAVIEPSQRGFLPIEFVGEISARVGDKVMHDESYGSRRVLLVPVEQGRQEMGIDFAFTDDGQAEVPQVAPPRRGPYAHLVVASPIEFTGATYLQLVVRGWAFDSENRMIFDRIVVRTNDGDIETKIERRNDVAEVFGDQRLASSGFRATLNLSDSLSVFHPIKLVAISSDGTEEIIGEVKSPDWNVNPSHPRVSQTTSSQVAIDLQSWFVLGENPSLLKAISQAPKRLGWTVIKSFLGIAQFAIYFLVPSVLFLRRWKGSMRSLASAFFFACGAGLVALLVNKYSFVWPLRLLPAPVAVAAVLVGPLVYLNYRRSGATFIYVVVSSMLFSFPIVLSMVRRYSGLDEFPSWWNFAIFRDRATDWFVFQDIHIGSWSSSRYEQVRESFISCLARDISYFSRT